jgi:hypothetical protein
MQNNLRERALDFALRIGALHDSMQEKRGTARVLSNQILRSGTAIG